MTRQDKVVVITVVLIIFFMGVIFGMMLEAVTPPVSAAAVDAEVEAGNRELIEGGAMLCVRVEEQEMDPAPAETPAAVPEEVIPIYSVDGHTLAPYLQRYLYRQLKERGVEGLYKTALLQIYQESRYDPSITAKNGVDQGLCQLQWPYSQKFAAAAGLYEFDPYNAIDSLYVYAYLMSEYLKSEGAVEMALSKYYTGRTGYCGSYVNDVMKWAGSMVEVSE